MRLKKLLNENEVYCKVENEIREWVEKTYSGLSIEFYPHLEIVRTNELIDFSQEQVKKIVEVVNLKIEELLEKYDEEIYIAERLTRIWKKHPEFNPEIENIEELKKHPKFLKYLKELIIRTPKKKKSNIIQMPDYRRKGENNGK